MLEKTVKEAIRSEFARHGEDTGSPEVQVALITKRIELLTEHFKRHKKDFNSRRGFLQLIGQRRRLLRHLREEDPARYQELLKRLKLRK